MADTTISAQSYGMCSHCLSALSTKASLNPAQGFNSNHSNLTKRGWGGLLKCSHGSKMAQKYNGLSTLERVRVWGINTPLSKTSRCSVRVRPVKPVGSNKLAVGPRPVRTVGWTGQTGHTRYSSPKCFSLIFLTWDSYEHFWLCQTTDVTSPLIVRHPILKFT